MEKSRIRRFAIPTAALLLAAVMVLVLFKGDEATVSPVTPLAAKTFSPLNSAEVVTFITLWKWHRTGHAFYPG